MQGAETGVVYGKAEARKSYKEQRQRTVRGDRGGDGLWGEETEIGNGERRQGRITRSKGRDGLSGEEAGKDWTGKGRECLWGSDASKGYREQRQGRVTGKKEARKNYGHQMHRQVTWSIGRDRLGGAKARKCYGEPRQ